MFVTRTCGNFLTQIFKQNLPTVPIFGAKRGNAELAAKRAAQNPKILITG